MQNNKPITIATLGSHSALDICRGAKDEGFKTLVIVQKGRGNTYTKYYKTHPSTSSGQEALGCVDEIIEVEKFSDILSDAVQQKLLDANAIFVPHRSFEVYINDYDAIEHKFKVPMFGNKFLLKTEERGTKPNQYDLLQAAGIRFPKQTTNPNDIDRLCLVKVLEKERGFERAFFLASSTEEFNKASSELIEKGKITKEALTHAVIEEFIVGVQVNFNFFYDPINQRLELLGTDTRRQTNLEGYSKIPPADYEKVKETYGVSYEESGHIAATVLESMLEKVFEIGERFVKATQDSEFGGVAGPFGLQSMIIPGPPKKDIIVFDVSPRMPGSPGITATPYSSYLFGKSISAGKRVAMLIKEAVKKNELEKITT